MKKCSKCKETKSTDEFCKDKKCSDGYQSQCKKCKRNWIAYYSKTEAYRSKKRQWEKCDGRRQYKLAYYHKHKLSYNMSRRIRHSLQTHKAGRRWETVVGYSLDELKCHLESQFQQGMSWDNYGEVWHIDHNRPIDSFDITSVECEDFKECWSLDNLKPMFARENLQKSNKYGPFV